MKWTSMLKQKHRVILALFIILVALGLAGLLHRKNYDKLDEHITSIYEDRLLPATFLFDMIEVFYRKKITLSQSAVAGDSVANVISSYNNELAVLVKNYEATYLTENEKIQWAIFMQNMKLYNNSEVEFMRSSTTYQESSQLHEYFDKAIYSLNQLAAIQVKEGDLLRKNSRSIIAGSMINMQLEIALLVILGIIALMMAGVTKFSFFQPKQGRELLN